MEITKQSIGVQRVGAYRHGDLPIVPMHGLAHSRHHNGVRRGKCALNSKFKHEIEYMVCPQMCRNIECFTAMWKSLLFHDELRTFDA